MKIVKRDGRTVDYNPDKIRIAIGKANDAVSKSERVSDESIDVIISYIEELDKKRMLVEDIQDIIEMKLMEMGKFVLAKKYIIYRYKRSIIRQSNTTDASILSLLKNASSKDGVYLVANKQRDVMAGEASKDLAYRLLLPKNVVDADKDNRIKFTKIEHFTEPVIESSKINLADMLDGGTVINGVMIETPKSFQSACNVLVEIVGSISYCQTGAMYIELKDLFKYYNMTYEKKYSMYKSLMKNELNNDQVRALSETQSFLEVKSGIQTIFYQINTLTLPNGRVPEVYFLINLDEIECEYEEKIVFEFVRQKVSGIKDENGKLFIPDYPSIVLSLNGNSPSSLKYDYIESELLSSSASFVAMNSKKYREFNHNLGRFNQGSLILNLGRLALLSENVSDFIDKLDENLNYCYEGFLCRNHNLQGILSDKSPIHFRFGAIARMQSLEKIDSFLKKENSYMSLCVIGFEASVRILGGDEYKKVIRDKIDNTIKKWNKENTFDVVLSNYYDEETVHSMFEFDRLELKKYSINCYYDSLEFMQKDYFENGEFYYLTDKSIDLCDEAIVSQNIIIQKKASLL